MRNLHETCQQYVRRLQSEGWKIAGKRGCHLLLRSPDGKVLRPIDLRNDVLTVYSTASDGDAYAYHATQYDTAHDAANADVLRAGNDQFYLENGLIGGPYYVVSRGFLYFDTSALGATAVISAAVLSLYGMVAIENDAVGDHSDLGIVEGVQSDPFDAADYGDHLSKTTLGADTYYTHPIATDDYNDKALNATGIGWINKTGTTLFCLRLKGDIDKSTPTGENLVGVWANEKGAGYLPKLVITYTPAVAGRSYGFIAG